MVAERRHRATARRPQPGVYEHLRYGWLHSLTDPKINFVELTGRASPDEANLEGRLCRFLTNVYWPWRDSGASKLDPAWLQSGNGAPVSGYAEQPSKRHKGEHSYGPGIAAELETVRVDPPIIHFEQVVDRLMTTGALTDRHLWMLEEVWRCGRLRERPNEDKPIGHRPLHARRSDAKLSEAQAAEIRTSTDSLKTLAKRYDINPRTVFAIKHGEMYRTVDPEQSCAAQLQVSNAAVRRMWDCVTTTLYFEVFGV